MWTPLVVPMRAAPASNMAVASPRVLIPPTAMMATSFLAISFMKITSASVRAAETFLHRTSAEQPNVFLRCPWPKESLFDFGRKPRPHLYSHVFYPLRIERTETVNLDLTK